MFFLTVFQAVCHSPAWNTLPLLLRPSSDEVVRLMLKSKAASTSNKYVKEILKFFTWCHRNYIEIIVPFSSATVSIYLFNLSKEKKSYSSLVLAYSALKWLNSFCPSVNELDSGFCKNVIESAKRTRTQPVNKKKPLPSHILKEIIDKYASDSANLMDLRIAAMCSIGFAGFLRFNELSNLKPAHFSFQYNYAKILIPESKTDIYREGNYVYISRTTTKYCPVSVVESYMNLANISKTCNLPLFRRIIKKKTGYSLGNDKLSYTRCRELFKDCISSLGYDPTVYGLHSLRSGGATAAVSTNRYISERLLKLHGRWKSDVAKDMYILEPVESRLEISRSLNL